MNDKLYTAMQIDSQNELQSVRTVHNDVTMTDYIAELAERMERE